MFQQLLKVPPRQLKILPTNISLLPCKKVRNKYLTFISLIYDCTHLGRLNGELLNTSTSCGGEYRNQRNKNFYPRWLQVISGIKIGLRLPEVTQGNSILVVLTK